MLTLAHKTVNRAYQQTTGSLDCAYRVLAMTEKSHTLLFKGWNNYLCDPAGQSCHLVLNAGFYLSVPLLCGWHWQQTHVFRVLCVMVVDGRTGIAVRARSKFITVSVKDRLISTIRIFTLTILIDNSFGLLMKLRLYKNFIFLEFINKYINDIIWILWWILA